jgi:hypothetical protein
MEGTREGKGINEIFTKNNVYFCNKTQQQLFHEDYEERRKKRSFSRIN